MLAYSADALVILARVYMRATHAPAARLGLQATGNHHLFERLLQGYDCLTRNADSASDWFDENWPIGLPWPREVPPRYTERKPSAPTSESRRRAPVARGVTRSI